MNPQAWPQRLSWENPVAYGPDGAIWTATEDWLLAEYGPRPQSSAQIAAAVAAAVVAAPPKQRFAANDVAGMPALLTADEAATALRTSRRNLHRWIAAGRLRAVRGGSGGSSRVLVPRESIKEFLASLNAR